MGFLPGSGMLLPIEVMKPPRQTVICWLAVALLAAGYPFRGEAKSYSSGGGHSYSSHSSGSGGSHSFSSAGSHSFSSGGSHSSSSGGHSSSGGFTHSSSSSSGKSYSSGSTSSDSDRHSYTSAKSYSSGASHTFSSSSGSASHVRESRAARSGEPNEGANALTFDTAAARARRDEASKAKFTQFQASQNPPPTAPATPSYRVKPPPMPGSAGGSGRPVVYVPDAGTLSSRPVRIYNVFNPYWSRPVVIYRDPYNSLFWWWLLDRSIDDRAWWAYHHRYDMDPARYQALVAQDQQLEARVQQLEAQQAPRNPNYAPPGVDQDLMYTDRHVERAYSNRPTTAGVVTFWLLAVPLALGLSGFFIWLIWFKRWQPATPQLA